MPLPPVYDEPTEELANFYRSVAEGILKIPQKIPSSAIKVGKEIVIPPKEYTISDFLHAVLKGAFFPMEVTSRATEKAIKESLQKRGYKEAEAERFGELLGFGAALSFPYGIYEAGKGTAALGKILLKGKEAVEAEKALRGARRVEFLKKLAEQRPEKPIDLEKLSPHIRELYIRKAPELREKTKRLLEELYPVKKELIKEHFRPAHRKLAEYMELGGVDIQQYWTDVEHEMKRAKEIYKNIFRDYLSAHVPDFPLLTEGEVDLLFELVKSSNLTYAQKLSATRGLITILGGDVPFPKDITYIRVVLGEDWTSALKAYRKAISKRRDLSGAQKIFTEIFAVPRAILSSYDISALLRQALPFVGRKEWRQNVPTYIRAFKEENYNKIMASILSDPFFEFSQKYKLSLSELDTLNEAEELFISRLAKHIPGIGASERGYTAFLNKLRFDLFKDFATKAVELGYDPVKDADIFRKLASHINIATGKMPIKASGWLYTMMSFGFFAPKLYVSRLAYPFQIWRLPKGFKNEFFRELASMATLGFGFLTLAKIVGGEAVDIITNPANADFLKVKIGDFRLDPWGGFQQEVVLAYRVATGEAVSSTTGMPFTLGEGYGRATKLDMITRYMRNKLHPIAGYIYDYLDSYRLKIIKDWDWEEALKAIVPFIVNDIWETFEEDVRLIPLGLFGALGMGVQTYGVNDHLKPTIRKLNMPPYIVEPVNRELNRLGLQLKMNFEIEVGGPEERMTVKNRKIAENYKNLYTVYSYFKLFDDINKPWYSKLSDIDKIRYLKRNIKNYGERIRKFVFGYDPRIMGQRHKLIFDICFEILREEGFSPIESKQKAKTIADEFINNMIDEREEIRKEILKIYGSEEKQK